MKTGFSSASGYRLFAIIFFILGTLLRVLLFAANDAENSFDDHFEPIQWIMEHGEIPAKDACFQCYNPPVFYWVSAKIGSLAVSLGAKGNEVRKLLQFVCCFYGVLTLVVVYLILSKLNIPGFSKLLAFGTVCFLPRHIYMSAMHTNDTMCYLFATLSVYLLLVAAERRLSFSSLALLSICMTIAVFTKYTCFAVMPMAMMLFISAFRRQLIVPRRKFLVSCLSVFLLPVVLLTFYAVANMQRYHNPLPWNNSMYDPSSDRPRDNGRISFISFKPWQYMRLPILAPGQMDSFWTLVYSGMWFDTEPFFIEFLDTNRTWWDQYYKWYRGEQYFPGQNSSMTLFTRGSAALLIGVGLVPLVFVMIGAYRCVNRKGNTPGNVDLKQLIQWECIPVLFLCNAAEVIALTVRMPVYCSMKASYLLISMAPFAIFLGIGLTCCERIRGLKVAIATAFGVLFAVSTCLTFHIVISIFRIRA